MLHLRVEYNRLRVSYHPSVATVVETVRAFGWTFVAEWCCSTSPSDKASVYSMAMSKTKDSSAQKAEHVQQHGNPVAIVATAAKAECESTLGSVGILPHSTATSQPRGPTASNALSRFSSHFFRRASDSSKEKSMTLSSAEERRFWPRRFSNEKKIVPKHLEVLASVHQRPKVVPASGVHDPNSAPSGVTAPSSDTALRKHQLKLHEHSKGTASPNSSKNDTLRHPRPAAATDHRKPGKAALGRRRVSPNATPSPEPSLSMQHDDNGPSSLPPLDPPYSPQYALQNFGAELTDLERVEVLTYGDIYFYSTLEVKSHRRDGKVHDEAAHHHLSDSSPPPIELSNDGYDDDCGDYLVLLRDHIAYRFEVLHSLGSGSFGQVVCCLDHQTRQQVAVKIIRNRKKYKEQSLIEVQILSQLQRACLHQRHSASRLERDRHHSARVVQMQEYFMFRNHLCIAFELLGINLYDYLKLRFFQGLPVTTIRDIACQLVTTLALLKTQRVIHCDLKPENILIKAAEHHPDLAVQTASTVDASVPVNEVCLIDFGSSCLETAPIFTYIQSRFYRSPEVILGYPYNTAIDMWSFACILVELHTGHPIFAGENESEQLACIMEMFGVPSHEFLMLCKRRQLFFSEEARETNGNGSRDTTMLSFQPKPFVNSRGRKRTPGSRTFMNVVRSDDSAFIQFLTKCFVIDPRQRMTPEQAQLDPWIQKSQRGGGER